MVALRVFAEQLLSPVPGGIGRYTEQLIRELIATTPAGSTTEAIIAKHTADEVMELRRRLPGLADVSVGSMSRRELSQAWRVGLPIGRETGLLHAPSLFAPIFPHDGPRGRTQLAVTIHDAVPWTHPRTLTRNGAAWHRAMGRRATRYADAVVVPTHAVAEQLSEVLGLGDRVRVIGGAVSDSLELPPDAAERVERLGLPADYVLCVGTIDPRKGLTHLAAAMASPKLAELDLVHVGPDGWDAVRLSTAAMEAGVAETRLHTLGFLSDADLAAVYSQATVFAFPSLAEGFGLPLLEAFRFGAPVVHSDDPALVEVSGGAGIAVPLNENGSSYSERLADAIERVVSDEQLRQRLATAGFDRVKAYSWRDSARQVWRLHADL